ncbi:hypothetical protein [Lysobacter humi (ex Lee et al. 2017)]
MIHDVDAEREKIIRANESRWLSDARSSAEEAALEADINTVLSSKDLASVRSHPTDVHADCRVSMCKVEAGFGADGGGDWVVRMTLLLADRFATARNVTVVSADGTAREVLYLYRHGVIPPN